MRKKLCYSAILGFESGKNHPQFRNCLAGIPYTPIKPIYRKEQQRLLPASPGSPRLYRMAPILLRHQQATL